MDKAKNKTGLAIALIIISLLSYITPLLWNVFDFGLIFEVTSLVFLIIARSYMKDYETRRVKIYLVCSMVAVGWILIYDLILMIVTVRSLWDLVYLGYGALFGELFMVLYLIWLFTINRDLAKAENPMKYEEDMDWFYESYEGKEKGGK